MKAVVADTNAFLRFLLNDIPEQVQKTERLFEKAKKSEIVLIIPQIVIFELHFTLKTFYNFPKLEITRSLKSITQIPYLQIQDRTIFKAALELYAKSNVSLADCFILSYAREKKGELFTFDENLKKLK